MSEPRNLPPDWLLVLALVAGIFLWQRTTFPLWEIDLLPFQLAAYQYQHGDIEWIYAPTAKYAEWVERYKESSEQLFRGEGFGNPFFYPPFILPILAPCAELPAAFWRNALFVINTCLLGLFAYVILAVTKLARTWRTWLWAISFVLLAFPYARAIHLGQVVPILVALTWLGLLAMSRGADVRSGILLGFVSAVKIFPLALIVIPLLTRRYKLTATWLTTIAAIYAVGIAVMGSRIFVLWYEAVSEFGNLLYVFWGNQSLLGWWARNFRHRDLVEFTPYTDGGVELVKTLVTIVIGGTTLLALWLVRKNIQANFIAAVGVLICGMLLALTNAWEHYWLWALPVLGWAIANAFFAKTWGLQQVWIAGTAFFFLMKLTRFYTDDSLGRIITGSHTIGMIGLWLWLLCYILRTQRHPAENT